MPLFQFAITDSSGTLKDDPIDLSSVAEAKSQAVMMAGQMLKDARDKFWSDGHWRLEVSDAKGLLICAMEIDGTVAPAGSC